MQKDCTFAPHIKDKTTSEHSSINVSNKLYNDSKQKVERLKKQQQNLKQSENSK